jgi:saccharopine dehydrogenase-like NADP-dependent oxidoreductase
VSGLTDGRLTQHTYANKIYAAPVAGVMRTGIQITTAGAICAVLDLLAQGVLPAHGLIRQEDIALDAFLANRFGRAYAQGPAAAPAPADLETPMLKAAS